MVSVGTGIRTPACEDVGQDARVVVEYVKEDEVVQINAFHQDPVVVCEERVLPDHREHFARENLSRLVSGMRQVSERKQGGKSIRTHATQARAAFARDVA